MVNVLETIFMPPYPKNKRAKKLDNGQKQAYNDVPDYLEREIDEQIDNDENFKHFSSATQASHTARTEVPCFVLKWTDL